MSIRPASAAMSSGAVQSNFGHALVLAHVLSPPPRLSAPLARRTSYLICSEQLERARLPWRLSMPLSRGGPTSGQVTSPSTVDPRNGAVKCARLSAGVVVAVMVSTTGLTVGEPGMVVLPELLMTALRPLPRIAHVPAMTAATIAGFHLR